MMKNKLKLSLREKENLKAHLFLIPFYLGLLFFFLTPLIESLRMSFSNVSVGLDGYHYEPVGFENYRIAFFVDADFMLNIADSVKTMLWQIPLVNVLAIFLALLINQKFRGRLLVRAIFFMPLIFASSVAYDIVQGDFIAGAVMEGASVSTSGISYTSSFKDFLISSGVGEQLVTIVADIMERVFQVTWTAGVQMILYLAALQSIAPALYEAAKIEGASAWDCFWKITLPMLMPIMLVCMVYTVVDSFTSTNNVVMNQITSISSENITKMGISEAFAWIYFVVILAILGVIFLLFHLLGRDKKGVK